MSAATFGARFRSSARGGILLLQECRVCSCINPYTVTFLCHNCGSLDLREVPASGAGTVLSCTLVTRPSDPGPERVVILVELDEGIHVLAVAPQGDLKIGDRAHFSRLGPEDGALCFEAR